MTLYAMSDLDGPPPEPTTPEAPPPPPIGHNQPPKAVPLWKERQCPECMAAFKPHHPRTLFCCPEHKRAHNNRQTVRGATLAALDMAARETRDGTRGTAEEREAGKHAASEARRLKQKWRDEDRAAGRMSMVRYVMDRFKIGY